ncbi:cadmium resistance protein CadD (predicted permease) [Saccharothrix ecbatanensis]|uniref:Cadmium resistance protein CadD (Predicted permease) n=1 Tax=Saccharothrix ecbatanensis TaxID=1105145 RepID=A0A7W9HP56_9PSEU|nr:cadmium resistance transporter [Saccharothrix ecbatanensis]MBB5805478.1 cadmium resistance protein CadD (predicted permease) [Saccharothrix ecbatanensis]
MQDILRAVGLFAVTNVDDLVLLALFFSRGVPAWRVVLGQYLGFVGILVVAVAAAWGASLLPASVLPWLGLLPLALGVKAAWQAWRGGEDAEPVASGALGVAAVTFANGGDNIGVYVPVFATTGITAYVIVFLVLVGVWCAAGRFFATRPVVARALSRWGHVVLPVVLIGIGVLILLG